MQTAGPWQGGQTIARLKQNFEHTNLLLQLVAATLFHRGMPKSKTQDLHSATLFSATPWKRLRLQPSLELLWFIPAPGLSVPPARHRLGAVNLLDCPLRAPVSIRGRSGSTTQSTAGSEPCLSALLDAAPTAHSACLPSCALSTHHRLQITQHKKSLPRATKFKKRKSLMETLKTLYSPAKTKREEKSNH